jgi:dienelactone hydrolase
MTLLDSWTRGEHLGEVGGQEVSHATYRKGSGPGVVVIHEIPSLTPEVIAFGEEVVASGFTVVMPDLFGRAEQPMTPLSVGRTMAKLCVSREFTMFAAGATQPIATWLRGLARALHEELGGPGVGAVGMCFTGGFALAMMVDESMAAPVVAQPSTPFPVGRARARDLNLSPADLSAVRDRAAAGCQVLGLRYLDDPAVGRRFERLTEELGDAFIKVEFPGRKHSTLTVHRQQEALDRVLAFLHDKLD